MIYSDLQYSNCANLLGLKYLLILKILLDDLHLSDNGIYCSIINVGNIDKQDIAYYYNSNKILFIITHIEQPFDGCL